MRLVYKFKYHGSRKQDIMDLCIISKNLYNQALYEIKQNLRLSDKFLFYNDLNKIMQVRENLEGNINYRMLKAQVSQQCLRVLDKNISSYIKSVKEWSKNKEKYKGMPKMPSYKKKYNSIIYTNQCSKISDGYLNLSKTLRIKIPQYEKYSEKLKNYKQCRIIPSSCGITIEMIYDDNSKINCMLDKNKYASVDLGVDNLATVIFDRGETAIYSGKILKSVNQYTNKTIAKYKSELEIKNKRKKSKKTIGLWKKRNNRINDMFHKISREIVNKMIENHIGTIIVGYNKGWKDSIRIGKRNNQIFVGIPFYDLISKLSYKCEKCGITFITREESYTSKCDALAMEPIGRHDSYSGKRIKRGLYQSSVGKTINADVNGALNIMRKVIGDSYPNEIIDSGRLFRPIKCDIL